LEKEKNGAKQKNRKTFAHFEMTYDLSHQHKHEKRILVKTLYDSLDCYGRPKRAMCFKLTRRVHVHVSLCYPSLLTSKCRTKHHTYDEWLVEGLAQTPAFIVNVYHVEIMNVLVKIIIIKGIDFICETKLFFISF
jgi:hypothetical protein